MLSLKKVFSPGGKKFYDLFDEVCNNLLEMSHVFVKSIHEDSVVAQRSDLVQLFELEDKMIL